MSEQNVFAELLKSPALAELGPGPRAGVIPEPALNTKLDELFARINLSHEKQNLVRALILLWHDHLDAAHQLAQNSDTQDGAFVHGIMHRREPDLGNAAYWFRRVGSHPAFKEIFARATELSRSQPASSLPNLSAKQGIWDPFAFIDACGSATNEDLSEEQTRSLQEIQRIEFEALLDWLCS
jgi:hypothetical protein